MPNQTMGWGKVTLAILPGLFALGLKLTVPGHHLWFIWGSISLCFVLCVIGFVREGYLPVWSFPAFGIGLMYFAFLIINLVDKEGMRWLYPFLLIMLYGIVPMLAGLFLARRTGILAGLVFIGVAYVFWESIGDPDYALMMYTDNQALVTFVSICPPLFFLIVVPIVVMRFPSMEARMIGYFVPIMVALIVAAGLSSTVRPYSSFAWIVSMDFLFIVLPLIITVGVCALVEKRVASALNFASQP